MAKNNQLRVNCIGVAFIGYHIASYFLRRRGYCVKFFRYGWYGSFPVAIAALYLNNVKYYKDMYRKGILDYHLKRVRYKRDVEVFNRFMLNAQA